MFGKCHADVAYNEENHFVITVQAFYHVEMWVIYGEKTLEHAISIPSYDD